MYIQSYIYSQLSRVPQVAVIPEMTAGFSNQFLKKLPRFMSTNILGSKRNDMSLHCLAGPNESGSAEPASWVTSRKSRRLPFWKRSTWSDSVWPLCALHWRHLCSVDYSWCLKHPTVVHAKQQQHADCWFTKWNINDESILKV